MTSSTRTSKAIQYALEGAAVLILAAIIAVMIALHVTRPPIRYGQQAATLGETVQARVLDVLEESVATDETGLYTVAQKLDVEILSAGAYHGKQITLTYNGMGPTLGAARFRAGERALVMVSKRPNGEPFFQVADHVRIAPLATVTALFAALTIAIGRWQGVRALLGLALSALLIGGFVLPQILAHRDPVLASMIGAAVLLAVTLYLIQGWNQESHVALLGMLAGLALTGILAIAVTKLTYLTGFGSEDTLYLQAVGVNIEMRGLLLAGMIIGTAGVLDDVVIAQSVTAFELARADTTLTRYEIYRRSMRIGVAHLASMVNTLVLAYVSAALPLIILFYLYPEPWYLTINRELIAEEIVRSLVGSIGLMTAVPLTSAIAAWVAGVGRTSLKMRG